MAAPRSSVATGGAVVVSVCLACACGAISDPPRGNRTAPVRPGSPPFAPGPAVMPRLTTLQYRNTIRDLLGEALPEPPLEPDTNPYLFTTIGASTSTLSELGTQELEEAAYAISSAVFDDAGRSATLVECAPAGPGDGCVTEFLTRFARRAFRRPVEADEIAPYVDVASRLARGDPSKGLRYAVAAILQAPSFVYRVEVGEADPTKAGRRRYTSWEMASRLSYLFWNTMPDEELAHSAESGALVRPDAVRREAERLLASPRAHGAVRDFFIEYLALSGLTSLNRDPARFAPMTPTLGASMKREVELLVEDVVFTRGGDLRALFDARSTFVNADLAPVYELPIPRGATPLDFVRVTLPEDGPRAGLLTTAAVLAYGAHPDSTSPTARGKYVRERLLCEKIPDPPPNVTPRLPDEDGATAPQTLRERLEQHRSDPECAACHSRTDPLGLGLEDFDAIGAHRTMEAGRPVDARGDLDGLEFFGARELGEIIRDDDRVPRCITLQLFRHATGRLDVDSEERAIDELTQRFRDSGYRFDRLLVELVSSDAFRTLGGEP